MQYYFQDVSFIYKPFCNKVDIEQNFKNYFQGEKMTNTKTILNNQSGFTLIELIMVIVILGILAVVAIPKYADMQTEAAEAAAEGVFGAAQGAAAINFAMGLVSPSGQPAGDVIDSGTDLFAAMDGTPGDWTTTSSDDGIQVIINSVTYTITIDSNEGSTNKAALSKDF